MRARQQRRSRHHETASFGHVGSGVLVGRAGTRQGQPATRAGLRRTEENQGSVGNKDDEERPTCGRASSKKTPQRQIPRKTRGKRPHRHSPRRLESVSPYSQHLGAPARIFQRARARAGTSVFTRSRTTVSVIAVINVTRESFSRECDDLGHDKRAAPRARASRRPSLRARRARVRGRAMDLQRALPRTFVEKKKRPCAAGGAVASRPIDAPRGARTSPRHRARACFQAGAAPREARGDGGVGGGGELASRRARARAAPPLDRLGPRLASGAALGPGR